MSFSIICMSMTAHCVFIAKRNLNIEPQTIFTAVILCCNWFIITSVILPFPAHHRLSARVRCIERTPSTQCRFCFSPTSRESPLAIFPVDRSSSEPIAEARKTSPLLGTVFKLLQRTAKSKYSKSVNRRYAMHPAAARNVK